MTLHVMVDFETLSSFAPTAPALSAGIVVFDTMAHPDNCIVECAYIKGIDITYQLQHMGKMIDWGTLCWWSIQSEEARAEVFVEESSSTIIEVAETLNSLYDKYGKAMPIWGNGANFDITILDSIYKHMMLRTPYSYRNIRCYREYMQNKARPYKPEVSHNAMHDAIAQAKNVVAAMWAQRNEDSF